MNIKSKTLLSFGAMGFIIVLALNLFSLIVLKQEAAFPSEDIWWPAWFPHYAVWISIYIAGIYKYALK